VILACSGQYDLPPTLGLQQNRKSGWPGSPIGYRHDVGPSLSKETSPADGLAIPRFFIVSPRKVRKRPNPHAPCARRNDHDGSRRHDVWIVPRSGLSPLKVLAKQPATAATATHRMKLLSRPNARPGRPPAAANLFGGERRGECGRRHGVALFTSGRRKAEHSRQYAVFLQRGLAPVRRRQSPFVRFAYSQDDGLTNALAR
jgi:hypothetical protein